MSSTDPSPDVMPQDLAPTRDCPITGSSGWQAWVNAMPGTGRPKLIVVGKVQVPGGGRRVTLEAGATRESHPPVQTVIVRVTGPTGGSTGGLAEHEVRFEMPALNAYGAVVVQCGSRTLATVDDVLRAL